MAKRTTHRVDEAEIMNNVAARYQSKEKIKQAYTFAVTFNDLLDSKGVDQEVIANDLGISFGAISNYRNGKAEPKLINLIAIADYLGVDCNFLMTGVKSEYARVSRVTGLSGKALNELKMLSARGNRPGERGAYIDGVQVDELALLDKLLTSDRFHQLFNALSKYLVYGKSTASNPSADMSDNEYSKMQEWLANRGLAIESKKKICDMYLQNAADELKAIYKAVLKEKQI